uniref:LAGLIDADG endonuclease n=1 Tax=Ophiocordycipitaceae sp. TaxID=1907519 RepID=A0A7S8HP49_9HYPO|nr:LAGLIDADG endonuclease [Ophiocordycipitaceae sp.]QUT09492.1 LAGLIDADG endonuclease [Ophiocordycipitaceae sp.]QUT09520.1 LAGLIDADG endonuclease [Ophiocordycipitaceae sp.]QUT13250.1 LAGLIDADG endonuclease [Ophiocordycipitaceae sp.]DAJ12188.1 TPA_asm: LAGLIDADG endonuclease [Ophiocordycipitaceae sp.]
MWKINKFLFVSGVILANASLDIAFHDTVFIVLLGIIVLMETKKFYVDSFNFSSAKLAPEQDSYKLSDDSQVTKDNYNEYVKMFWVGLMDGDGSIQVNHWREQSLQYRLVIKLSNILSNYNMLIEIAKRVGGTVRITGKGADVIWVVNKKQEVEKIIKIYDTYPPLTSKKICQLATLKACLTETSVKPYLLNRNLKYNQQLTIIKSKANFNIPTYFKGWLSGFIEAEGCFSRRAPNIQSFSIGQNDDFYLIEAIQQYFEVTNKVRNPYGKFYFLEVYKKEALLKITTHCTNYPLLGEKLESLNKFSKKLV